jgi:hypothetical protein
MSAEPGQRPASCREFVEDLTGQSRAAAAASQAAPPADVWYLVYRDENNQAHTVKGSTDGIRKALRERLLGDPSGIVVSRTKNGQFVPLHSAPEFRDLVVTPVPMPIPGGRTGAPDEAVDYGTPAPAAPSSSAVHRGRPTPTSGKYAPPPSGQYAPPPSGRYAPPPSGRYAASVPPPQSPARKSGDVSRTHTPTRAGGADETDHDSAPAPRGSSRLSQRPRAERARKPFNWTPLLLVLVALLSAAVGYLLFAR